MADEAVFSRYLPEDLISNILLRLPIRSLLVCTSVSKTWNSFIKSPAFFSSHLNHTISSRQEKDSDLCLLQLCSLPVVTGTDSFSLRSKDRDLSEYEQIHFPFPPDQIGFQVVASCNGLVYFMHGRFNLYSCSYHWVLWNPAIRKTMLITERQNARALEAVGLGFDSKSNDFKVLSIVEEPFRNQNLRVNLYSLKANSWKRLPDLDAVNINDNSMHREMAFVNGVLHFIALQLNFKKPRYLILGFDLVDENFREIMLPDCMANHVSKRFIATCGESLSVLWLEDSVCSMEIWVMKEYGVEESWTKVSTVRLLESLLDWRALSITGFVFKDDSHVFLSFSSYIYGDAVGKIFSHDLRSHETKEIQLDGKSTCYYLGNYVESLVLLDEAKDRPSEIEQDFMSNFYESLGGLDDKANDHQPSEIEPDDGNDACGSSSPCDAGHVYDHGALGDEANDHQPSEIEPGDGNDVRGSSAPCDADCSLGAEKTANLEDSDKIWHAMYR